MRTAHLASLVQLVSGAALTSLVACGGTGGPPPDPLNTRDTPPSSTDTPPSGTDTPPASTDPANSCISCTGSYSCYADSDPGTTVTITLGVANGVCNVASGGSVVSTSVPSCETGGATSVTVGNETATLSRGPGAGFTVCVTGGDAGDECATCTPTSAGGSGSGGDDDGGVTITGNGGGTSSGNGGGACAELSACCGSLPAADQSACTSSVATDDATVCSDALDELKGISGCQ